jgi:hypothetical protein
MAETKFDGTCDSCHRRCRLIPIMVKNTKSNNPVGLSNLDQSKPEIWHVCKGCEIEIFFREDIEN